ncbi:MAG: hypothetical protein KAY46_03855 [Burkholderiaceae bacterium]|nr:hypothetical protein [Burkholderiaceae bacterium]
MTDDSATARQELPAAPPQELFRDDFGANGGVLAPRTLEEFHQWLSKEVAIWGWVQSVGNAGNFRSVIDGPVALLVEAANQVRTALDIERRGAGPIDHHIEEARRYAARALRDGRLPHSTTPLHHRVDALRQEDSVAAVAYLFASGVGREGEQVNSFSSSMVRGLVLGVVDQFESGQSREASIQSQARAIDELRARGETVLGESRILAGNQAREFESQVQSLVDERKANSDAFASELEAIKGAHGLALEKHAKEMGDIQSQFRTGQALRAPVEYWTKKAAEHKDAAQNWLGASIGGFLILVVAVGLSAALWVYPDGVKMADFANWGRVAVLTTMAFAIVWLLRLCIRLYLNRSHLATDAEERATMAQTYLALLDADKELSTESRHLILQALFRPTADGFVKEEGSSHPIIEVLSRTQRSGP